MKRVTSASGSRSYGTAVPRRAKPPFRPLAPLPIRRALDHAHARAAEGEDAGAGEAGDAAPDDGDVDASRPREGPVGGRCRRRARAGRSSRDRSSQRAVDAVGLGHEACRARARRAPPRRRAAAQRERLTSSSIPAGASAAGARGRRRAPGESRGVGGGRRSIAERVEDVVGGEERRGALADQPVRPGRERGRDLARARRRRPGRARARSRP